jgi:hypothetical protein
MNIYIRVKPRWINFVNREELTEIINNYTGAPICIGDLATFNAVTMQQLLKFVEDNPQIDLYSSQDITVAPLLSRAIKVVKEYKTPVKDSNPEEYFNSQKSYTDIEQYMSDLTYSQKLVLKGTPQRLVRLMLVES